MSPFILCKTFPFLASLIDLALLSEIIRIKISSFCEIRTKVPSSFHVKFPTKVIMSIISEKNWMAMIL